MRILNIEDDVFKHDDIKRKLKDEFMSVNMDHVNNLDSGLEKIKSSIENNTPYDLIISDMIYPVRPGERPEHCGEMLIDKLKEMDINVPVILCSSDDYHQFPGILGAVHYSPNKDWERELISLIRSLHLR